MMQVKLETDDGITVLRDPVRDDAGERCPDCGAPRKRRTCWQCGLSAELIDCGHYPQPRPIAQGYGMGDDLGRSYCDQCSEWYEHRDALAACETLDEWLEVADPHLLHTRPEVSLDECCPWDADTWYGDVGDGYEYVASDATRLVVLRCTPDGYTPHHCEFEIRYSGEVGVQDSR